MAVVKFAFVSCARVLATSNGFKQAEAKAFARPPDNHSFTNRFGGGSFVMELSAIAVRQWVVERDGNI